MDLTLNRIKWGPKPIIYIIIPVVCLSVCPPIFSEVLRPTAAKLGEGVWLEQGKTKFECFGDAMTERGHPRSNGGQILIDSRMEVKLGGWSRRPMPKMLKVDSRSSKVKRGQILTDSRTEAKLGGWSRRPMPKMLKVI